MLPLLVPLPDVVPLPPLDELDPLAELLVLVGPVPGVEGVAELQLTIEAAPSVAASLIERMIFILCLS